LYNELVIIKLSNRKKLFTGLIVFIIILIGVFATLYLENKTKNKTLVYTIDSANYCSWSNGQINGTSEVIEHTYKITIKKSDQNAFIKHAAATGECAYLYPKQPLP